MTGEENVTFGSKAPANKALKLTAYCRVFSGWFASGGFGNCR